jgi:radical SAM-linked protein
MILRVRYAKFGKVRLTSHRDTARIWERAVRRTGLPVLTTSGFTPRPRVSFGLALPTGAESIAEYLDLDVVDRAGGEADLGDLAYLLTDALPRGFQVLVAAAVAPGSNSLQDAVTSVTWELTAPAGADSAVAADRLLSAEALPLEWERKGERRLDDVRPLIVSLATSADGATMIAELATVGRSLRPAELATLAFPDADPGRSAGTADTSMDRARREPARGVGAAGCRACAHRGGGRVRREQHGRDRHGVGRYGGEPGE